MIWTVISRKFDGRKTFFVLYLALVGSHASSQPADLTEEARSFVATAESKLSSAEDLLTVS